jgi:DnaJ-class molecular chaperone
MDDYSVLGATRADSIETITKKYKKLAFKWHPDRNRHNKENTEEKFKTISAAYNNIVNKKSNPFQTFTSSPNGEFNFGNLFTKINEFKDYFKDVNYEELLLNVIEKVNTFSDSKPKKTKTDNLYINANLELFDIYNNVKKTINIDRLRKCLDCVKSDDSVVKCNVCENEKYINKSIPLTFYGKSKTIIFSQQSDHSVNKTAGDIIININPKLHECYQIINNYDLLYTYYIHNIDDINTTDIILKHLDNKTHKFTVSNPVLNYKYKIENMGLFYNDESFPDRGNLFIVLTESFKNVNTSIEKK